MITQLIGRLVEKNPTHVVIDCHGVGYEVNISLHTFSQLPEQAQITLFTHLQIREDAHILYGFFTALERSVFRLLLSVSGVGASTARSMLSSMDPSQLQQAVIQEDLNAIKAIKGIGLKTAQRLILELKDKMLNLSDDHENILHKNNTTKEETLSALEVLGYSRKSSEKWISEIIQKNPESSVEELIKLALKKL